MIRALRCTQLRAGVSCTVTVMKVLLKMNGVTGDPKAVCAEFADAAQFVLQQRVRNLPSVSSRSAGCAASRPTAARSRIRNRAPNGL
jgi:hypothetical protein